MLTKTFFYKNNKTVYENKKENNFFDIFIVLKKCTQLFTPRVYYLFVRKQN